MILSISLLWLRWQKTLLLTPSWSMCWWWHPTDSWLGTINNQPRWLTAPRDSSVLHLRPTEKTSCPHRHRNTGTYRDTQRYAVWTNIMQYSNISSSDSHTLRKWWEEINLPGIISSSSPPVFSTPGNVLEVNRKPGAILYLSLSATVFSCGLYCLSISGFHLKSCCCCCDGEDERKFWQCKTIPYIFCLP